MSADQSSTTISEKFRPYYDYTLKLLEAIKSEDPNLMQDILSDICSDLSDEYSLDFPAYGPNVYDGWGSDC